MITNIKTEQEFAQIVGTNEGLVVVKLGAVWCAPCKVIDATLEEIDQEGIDATILKVNIDDLPEIASQFRVMSVPTTLFIKNKEVKTILNGTGTKNGIVELINEINAEG